MLRVQDHLGSRVFGDPKYRIFNCVIHEMLAFEVHGGVTYMLMHVFPHIKNRKNIGKYMGFYFNL